MKLIMVILAVSMLLIISGCVKTQIFTKEDKIYNPPIPRDNEPMNQSSVINDSLNNEYENYCSEVELPKSF